MFAHAAAYPAGLPAEETAAGPRLMRRRSLILVFALVVLRLTAVGRVLGRRRPGRDAEQWIG
jgi:hypothetical protein